MKKFLKFIFWTIMVLLLIVIVGGFVFIKTFDLNKYKSYVEKITYEQTGRKLSLTGDAGLKISLIPTVVLNDVSFSNASWAEEPEMIKAKSVEVAVSIMPLLHKEVVIDTVNLIEPEVYLAVNADGKANWEFSKPQVKAENNQISTVEGDVDTMVEIAVEQETSANSTTSAAPLLAGFLAKQVNIENAKLIYQDMTTGSVTNLQVNSLTLRTESMNADLDIAFDLVFNGEEISGTATAGSINAILQGAEKYPVKAEVAAFGAKAQADVVLTNMMTDLGFNGSAVLKNPSGNFGAPAVSLEAEFSGTPKNIALKINSLNVAGNVINGTADVDLNGNKPNIKAALHSTSLNLQTLTATPVKTASFALIPVAAAAEYVPNTPLDLSVLNSVNAQASADVKSLIVNPDLVLENVQVKAVLQNGKLNVSPLSLNAGGGDVNGMFSVAATNNAFDLTLTGKDVVLQNLWKGLAATDAGTFGIISGGNTTLSVQLSGQGKTLRQMVESLDGQVVAIVGESKIQTGALKYLTGNFVTQLLKTLKIDKQKKNLELSCAVVRTDIGSGKASFPKGIVFNSKQLAIVSDGAVNLKNDKIDFTINPFNGKLADTNVVQAISSMIKVAGTVEEPKIAIDDSAVIKNVVGVAAAGPAFLGSQMMLDVDESPCYTALKGTAYQDMFPAPKGAKAAGQGVYQGTSEAISDSVDALTNTAKDVLNMFKRKN